MLSTSTQVSQVEDFALALPFTIHGKEN